jgi:nucleoid-associated protein YgaU
MNRTFAARGVYISLVVLVGVAALIWWLLTAGRLDTSLAPSASKAPADQSKPVVSAPAPEKPASAIAEANKTIKDLGDRLGPSTPLPPASTDPAPAFDVARVESNGEAVIAGRAVANSSVELLVDGKVHDRTTADSSGAFVFVPKPLPPGKYDLTLRGTAPDGKVMVSKSPVAVALVASDQAPVAALTAPKSPATAQPSSPTAPPAAPGEAAKSQDGVASKSADLRIESVEAEAGGGLFVSGRAAPGSRIRLYMNDGYIAMGTASPEGRVSFSIQSGVRPGDYRIRLDQMSASDSVASRVEIPFRAPATVAALAPSAPSQTPASPAAPESVIASGQPASPPQAPVAAEQKPAAPPASAPSAATSQPAPSQPASPGSTPKEPATGPAKEPLVRSVESAAPSPAPVATAPQPKSAASAGPAQGATPAAEPNTRSAQTGKADAATSQPSASSPVVAAAGSPPKVASNMSPRIAEPTKDRRDAVVIPRIDTKLIVRGDNLWRISEATYGMGRRYTVIFGANRDKIRDPDLIYPGQIFVLPKSRSGK